MSNSFIRKIAQASARIQNIHESNKLIKFAIYTGRKSTLLRKAKKHGAHSSVSSSVSPRDADTQWNRKLKPASTEVQVMVDKPCQAI